MVCKAVFTLAATKINHLMSLICKCCLRQLAMNTIESTSISLTLVHLTPIVAHASVSQFTFQLYSLFKFRIHSSP